MKPINDSIQFKNQSGRWFTITYKGTDKNKIFGFHTKTGEYVQFGEPKVSSLTDGNFTDITVGDVFPFHPVELKEMFTVGCILCNDGKKTFTDRNVTFTVRKGK